MQLLCIVLSLSPSSNFGTSKCILQIVSEYDPFSVVGSSSLYYSRAAATYDEAIAECRKYNATLVEIQNDQEWSEVKLVN